MTDRIKIAIASDVVCPWCIIGYERVVKAISEMRIQNMVEIAWHPFQLNPYMPAEGEEIHAHNARKYGTTNHHSSRTLTQMTDLRAQPVTVYKHVLSSSLQGEPLKTLV